MDCRGCRLRSHHAGASGSRRGSPAPRSPRTLRSLRSGATPPPAAAVVVPLSVLPPGLLPSATVTLPVNVGTRLPAGSSALSWTAGLIAPPATVLVGCWVNASRVAVPGVISNALLVTGPRPPPLAVSVRSEERRVGQEWRARCSPRD